MSKDNLRKMFDLADQIDRQEGLLAYERYHMVMRSIAERYRFPLDHVVAAFCTLSPNNDYVGNLRSTVSLLHGLNEGTPIDEIQCSTYRHCLLRAYDYASGKKAFVDEVKSLKILNFYHNVISPMDNQYVTIDGHMAAAWRGKRQTMKEAIVKGKREYNEIADATKALAFEQFILPNQYQAIIWFTRKRIFNIKASLQFGLFSPKDDVWCTLHNINEIKPFNKRTRHEVQETSSTGRNESNQGRLHEL